MTSTKPMALQKKGIEGRGETKATSPEMRSFKDYYLGMILKPRRMFDALMANSRRLKFGTQAIFVGTTAFIVYQFIYFVFNR
jgi:hypothetical protein